MNMQRLHTAQDLDLKLHAKSKLSSETVHKMVAWSQERAGFKGNLHSDGMASVGKQNVGEACKTQAYISEVPSY